MTEEKKQYDSPQQELFDVVEYKFQPIKGYPMLNWRGKRPFTTTQYYPAQLREIYGKDIDGWRNKIYWGDNLQVMSHLLKEYRGKIDLVYIDPPFDSKAEYKSHVSVKGKKIVNDQNAFEDKQYTDIWSNDEYLQYMYERIILIRELLSDKGSLILHCDPKKNYLLRSLLDETFGANHFVNEIIWHYQSGGRAKNFFSQKHDSLFWYRKSSSWTFNGEEVGEKRGDIKRNNMKREVEDDGRVYYSIKSAGKIYKYYEDDLIIPDDVWNISHLQQQDPERVNYPTQKPESLLERIIMALTNPDDLVFDCFMGSGTTQAVALKLGRRFIGADINLGAIQITTKRLLEISEEISETLFSQENEKICSGFEVYNVNHYDVFRNPVEAKDLLIDVLELQRVTAGSLFDGEKDGRMVKIMPVNRISTRADLSELIAGLDYKIYQKRQEKIPGKPVEKITLVCMGHEPDLGATLEHEVMPLKVEVEVVDILRDRGDLQFKRDSDAKIVVENGSLIIETFYPMNLLQKLSLQKEKVEDWRELAESVMVDWNYDGAVLQPETVDIPDKNELVKGKYNIPEDAGTIRVKITDLLSESLEMDLQHG